MTKERLNEDQQLEVSLLSRKLNEVSLIQVIEDFDRNRKENNMHFALVSYAMIRDVAKIGLIYILIS